MFGKQWELEIYSSHEGWKQQDPHSCPLEIVNLFARTNVIQVILLVRVYTHVLKYSYRNPLFFLLLIQQTWCVISHLKPHIIRMSFKA